MNDPALGLRIENRFVVLHVDLGSVSAVEDNSNSTESLSNNREELSTREDLPAIVLVDSKQDIGEILASNNLMTFLPDADQPIYDWMENILFYAEHALAMR